MLGNDIVHAILIYNFLHVCYFIKINIYSESLFSVDVFRALKRSI